MRTAIRRDEQHAGAVLTIDLRAIRQNYRLLAKMVGPDINCAGVVKADAYGLGAHRVAPALYQAGCRSFFVAQLDEGIDLRGHLPDDASIFVLNGLGNNSEGDCAEAGIVPVLNSLDQCDAWSACARKRGSLLPAAIQVDSGMSRLGLSPREVAILTGTPALGLDIRMVMSHLACADMPSHPANAYQLSAYQALAKHFPGARQSLANSSGIFLGRAFHHDVVRPGAALYGINPVPLQPNPMQPVVRLTAQVIQVRETEAGAHIGYGWDFHTEKPAQLATLSIGYADGLHRALGSKGVVTFQGRRLHIAGRVSMDSLTINLGDLAPDTLTRGTEVEIIGEHQSIDDLANAGDTIGYELLTGLGHRYKRIFLDDVDTGSVARTGDFAR